MISSPAIPVPDERRAIAQRALAQIGTPFRLHGRCADEALDCVGLVALAINVQQATPFYYSLRGDFEYDVIRFFDAANFHKCCAAFLDGDIVLVEASPRQLHLMVAAKNGFVHAHAGLRKITFTPGPPLWPVIGQWRLKQPLQGN
jgi:murein DD-endopeptidase / murein LD-carboxypeptidase